MKKLFIIQLTFFFLLIQLAFGDQTPVFTGFRRLLQDKKCSIQSTPISAKVISRQEKNDILRKDIQRKLEFKSNTGKFQSPIDFSTKNPNQFLTSKDGIAFQLQYGPSKLQVDDLDVVLVEGKNYAYVEGNTYEFDNYHLHYPSEHTIDGKPQTMEIHLVHKLTKFGSRPINFDKTPVYLVYGVFIEVGGRSPRTSAIKNILDRVTYKNGKPEVDTKPFNADLNKVISPALAKGAGTIGYYSGSLTTPPFSENVLWYVNFNERLSITQKEFDDYKKVQGAPNARPVRDIAGRKTILYC